MVLEGAAAIVGLAELEERVAKRLDAYFDGSLPTWPDMQAVYYWMDTVRGCVAAEDWGAAAAAVQSVSRALSEDRARYVGANAETPND